jgi:hypothetical protein
MTRDSNALFTSWGDGADRIAGMPGPLSMRSLVVVAAAACLIECRPAAAQSEASVDLVVPSGHALRVMLTESSTVHRVGQIVTAQLVEPVYAYDRIVLPVGTLVQGRITKLTEPSKVSRIRSMAAGDFSPHRAIEIRFESVLRDGESTAIETIAKNETPHPKRETAHPVPQPAPDAGKMARVEAEAKSQASAAFSALKQKTSEAIATAKDPKRLDSLKTWAIAKLPYRPQVLRKGTVYDAEFVAPVTLGTAPPHPLAPDGTLPAADSILTARLQTTLDSRATPRGSPLEAIVSEPVFAEDGRLIFPEGTKLTGEVTFAQPARRFHRNGQLRFLFERVEPPDRDSAPMLAALHAVDVNADDHVALDDEGGAAVQNSKTRFVEPALALLALRASTDQGEGRGFDGGATSARPAALSAGGGNSFGRGVGGLIGFGAIGFVLGRVSRPLGIAFGVAGAARSVYTNILGPGQELRFPADTPIQVQLAPGRTDGR